MSSKSLLIYSYQDDPHASTIEQVAKEHGLDCLIHSWHELPTLAAASIALDNEQDCSYWRSVNSGTLSKIAPDVVWSRRYIERPLPREAHKDDLEFIALQTKSFQRNWLYGALHNSRWINPPHAATAADCKVLQLKTARRFGLSLPATLISNDADMVRSFHEKHSKIGIIAKPLAWYLWHEGQDLFIPYTSSVEASNLLESLSMQMCPMIYQARIRKAFELRVTVMGDTVIAAKLLSQNGDERTSEDHRDSHLPQDVMVEPYQLPVSLELNLVAFVQSLGLEFAQIDMAVTPEGEHVFFEVNEAGQWLWIEERCPELPLLAHFIKFCFGKDALSEERVRKIKFENYFGRPFLDEKVKQLNGRFIPSEKASSANWPSSDLCNTDDSIRLQ